MPRTAKAGTRTKAKTKAKSKAKAARKTAARRTAKTAPKKTAATRRTARPAQARKLSKSTLRAKWIEDVDEHEERPGQSLATRSHDVIRLWAEERNAVPATVASTRHDGRPGVLRFDFPGFGGQSLEQVSWDEWFRTFDERNLVFVYQEHLKNGNQSNFFRLDNPEREEA